MQILVLVLLAASSPSPSHSTLPTIDWPDFFSRVTVTGVEYSDRLKRFEGERVRLRGYSIRTPQAPGALFLSREPFASSDAEETEIPFDVVGVVWRKGTVIPPIPARPTVEGVLKLGNVELGDQVVSVSLVDAIPVLPAPSGEKRRTKSH